MTHTRRGFLASLAAAVAGARALLAGTQDAGKVDGAVPWESRGTGYAGSCDRLPAEGTAYRMWQTGSTYEPEIRLMFDGVEYRVTAYSTASGTVTYERIERGA